MEDIFTERFNEILKNEKVSQVKLAEKIGLSKQCISDFKSGRAYPSIHTLRLICRELEVSADYLLGLSDY
ncbi:MAG: helix-turn-helix domain-containing protein [Clostridia bacterium]|nr:helix-turn-helix domain-containing protein [Clostridia bacterium]